MRAAYPPPALPGPFLLTEGVGLPSRSPGKDEQLHLCPRRKRPHTEHGARGKTAHQVCWAGGKPTAQCAESQWHFQLGGQFLVSVWTDRRCLNEELWITDPMKVSEEPLWTTPGQVRANYHASRYFRRKGSFTAFK